MGQRIAALAAVLDWDLCAHDPGCGHLVVYVPVKFTRLVKPLYKLRREFSLRELSEKLLQKSVFF